MARGPRRRLARRLLAAHGLVIAAGAATTAVVAVLVSPPVFHDHLQRALGPISDGVGGHLDQALSTALLLSLGIATAAAAATALGISWALASRLARPIERLSATAERLAAGDLSVRAPRAPADDELADLTATFNHMAASLEHTEDTRRQLLSDLAHELRTPLSTIEGYLEGLADGVVAADAHTWATLRDATGRLRHLVDDIALVSRAEEGRLELDRRPVDPARLVADAVAAARPAYRHHGIDLTTDTASSLPAVIVDANRIHEVLANLLDNARRHTPADGHVTVAASHHRDHVDIAVSDTGDGIDPHHLPHIFERFYRGDRARQTGAGSGIGLTIARAIARAHDGDLTAHSPGTGQGTTFTLHLPAHST